MTTSTDPFDVAATRTAAPDPHTEGARVMTICNSCRYCEGFCGVFPAMERRISFARGDLDFLANLCHNCGACFYACQYAPPHEFALNLPQALARIRLATYRDHAFPKSFGILYERQGPWLAAVLVVALALVMAAAALWQQSGAASGAVAAGKSFYSIIPHHMMVLLFGVAFGWSLLAMAVGAFRFLRANRGLDPGTARAVHGAGNEAIGRILRLDYLDGGGEGCVNENDAPSKGRRHLHHAVFYGFMLCFASTSIATIYHYAFGWPAPYPLFSLPVILGTVGGVLMVAGTTGMLMSRVRRDPRLADAEQQTMDLAFVGLLWAVSVTGLALLAWRDTVAMPAMLIIHLASVMAFFLLMPYGKFVHGVYRGLALLQHAREQRSPNRFSSLEG